MTVWLFWCSSDSCQQCHSNILSPNSVRGKYLIFHDHYCGHSSLFLVWYEKHVLRFIHSIRHSTETEKHGNMHLCLKNSKSIFITKLFLLSELLIPFIEHRNQKQKSLWSRKIFLPFVDICPIWIIETGGTDTSYHGNQLRASRSRK